MSVVACCPPARSCRGFTQWLWSLTAGPAPPLLLLRGDALLFVACWTLVLCRCYMIPSHPANDDGRNRWGLLLASSSGEELLLLLLLHQLLGRWWLSCCCCSLLCFFRSVFLLFFCLVAAAGGGPGGRRTSAAGGGGGGEILFYRYIALRYYLQLLNFCPPRVRRRLTF